MPRSDEKCREVAMWVGDVARPAGAGAPTAAAPSRPRWSSHASCTYAPPVGEEWVAPTPPPVCGSARAGVRVPVCGGGGEGG